MHRSSRPSPRRLRDRATVRQEIRATEHTEALAGLDTSLAADPSKDRSSHRHYSQSKFVGGLILINRPVTKGQVLTIVVIALIWAA